MGISLPWGGHEESRTGYKPKPFHSREISGSHKLVEGGATANGFFNIAAKFRKASHVRKAAACIPSHPMEIRKLTSGGSDAALRRWWTEYKHDIAASLGPVPNIGPLFIVTQKVVTEQAMNCYTEGHETSTDPNFSAQVHDAAKLSLCAGFQVQHDSQFGFQQTEYIPGTKYTIFMRSEKLWVNIFKKLKLEVAQLWQYAPHVSVSLKV